MNGGFGFGGFGGGFRGILKLAACVDKVKRCRIISEKIDDGEKEKGNLDKKKQ